MPVRVFAAGEGPFYACPAKTTKDMGIAEKIDVIIIINETIISNGEINSQGGYNQQQADPKMIG